ncbi:MAG: patatin-like phospholipase family protein [Candidatus Woesearchaeota archaeon]
MVKSALSLCGGALTGGGFELGALLALEHLTDKEFVDYDAFTGISIGSFGAAFLANGISVKEMIKLVNFKSDLGRIPLLTMLSMDRVDTFLSGIFSKPRNNYFHNLRKDLVLSATNLQTGSRAVFANPGLASRVDSSDEFLGDVTISKAVTASSAVPFLYKPVEINGEFYIDAEVHNTSNIGLLFELTSPDYMIVINPLVPLSASKLSRYKPIKFGRQVLSIFVHSRLQYSREHEEILKENKILSITPDPNDAHMEAMPFNLFKLNKCIQSGYDSVCDLFNSDPEHFVEFFNEFGLECNDYMFREYEYCKGHNLVKEFFLD